MLPSRHICLSLPLSIAVWSLTRSVSSGLLCFSFGVLIDADHIIEYIIHYGWGNYNFRKMYQACKSLTKPKEEGGVEKIYLFFHGIEIAILLWILSLLFAQNIYLLAITLGYTGHLFLDISANKLKLSAYFLTCRIKNDFGTIRLLKLP